jgi:hypothetical protein
MPASLFSVLAVRYAPKYVQLPGSPELYTCCQSWCGMLDPRAHRSRRWSGATPKSRLLGYFDPAGSRHRGAKIGGAEGLLCLGITAGASLETILLTRLALIARTT